MSNLDNLPSDSDLHLRVTRTDELIAAVAVAAGYHPHDQLVVAGFTGNRLLYCSASRGALSQPNSAPGPDDIATHVKAAIDNAVTSVAVLGYGAREHVDPLLRPVLDGAFTRAGIPVLAALRIENGRYWSYLDTTGDPAGTPFDLLGTRNMALCIHAGHVVLPNRDALAATIAPVTGPERSAMDDAVAAKRAETLGRLGMRHVALAAEKAVAEATARYAAGDRLTDTEMAWLLVLIEPAFGWEAALRGIDTQPCHVALWTDATRRAHPDVVSTAAALLAFAAWRQGSALARHAVDAAEATGQPHRLAVIMRQVVDTGLPPTALP